MYCAKLAIVLSGAALRRTRSVADGEMQGVAAARGGAVQGAGSDATSQRRRVTGCPRAAARFHAAVLRAVVLAPVVRGGSSRRRAVSSGLVDGTRGA